MANVNLGKLIAFCDRELKVKGFPDYKGAANGLQVENRGTVSKIAAAVDASLSTARKAVADGADLLLVHHGLFWNPSHPWTGRRYELIRFLVENNLAIYSAHLPLDAHPKLGNNVLLARALGFRNTTSFFQFEDRLIGAKIEIQISRQELFARVAKALGKEPLVIPGGPELCKRIGIVTGGAGGELAKAAGEGIDTLITGEGPHWSYALAEDLGVNVFYGGHYATETFGVRALAERLSRKFGIPWEFIDHPTGL